MRIAILLPDLRGGGAERVNIDLAKEFAHAGHEVEFVLLQARGELLEEAQGDLQVQALNVTRFRQAFGPLVRYLRQRRPDALLAAMWPLTGIAGLAVRRAGHQTRLVASEHNDFRMAPAIGRIELKALRYFGKWIYKPCHRVVAVSNGVADSLKDVAGLHSAKLAVIHNPVHPVPATSPDGEDLQAGSGWVSAATRLIAIGSFKQQKGFDVLFRALADVRRRRDAKLLILGDGPLRGDLEQLSRDLGIADHVWLPGFRPDPGAFLQHADVFVLSSNSEGFGNVIVEALSMGVPVVSTDCRSGPAEILENGKYGTLVPVGNSAALASATARTLESPIDRGALKQRASRFSPEIAAARYLDLLLGPSEKAE